jgi:hypothetical protein
VRKKKRRHSDERKKRDVVERKNINTTHDVVSRNASIFP